ncbi:MAG: KpsF/GutQ family sugar-phosphate isomerase [Alphaproteobacteria bacterium]
MGAVESGARVLHAEAAALSALAAALGANYQGAVAAMAQTRGRVVVTGMGKSGHIGGKIAATLASTGTPALFVHPGEASHGDLGMITKADTVLALSNSGDTAELDAVLSFCKRFAIPLVAITARPDSVLAEMADHLLLLPRVAEACPMGLAPTTSTTMMLALGDALAVSLLEQRGFSQDDYRVLHPGGKLGRKLLRVRDLMHSGEAMPLVKPETSVSDAILVMTAKRFGCVGIVDDGGTLVGIFTDGDLSRHLAPALLTQPVGAVMTKNPRTIRGEALAAEAINVMNAGKGPVTVLFIVEDGKPCVEDGKPSLEGGRPCGILHMHDCLRAGVA